MKYNVIDRKRIEDASGRVFVLQVELIHTAWYANLEERDANASTVKCFRQDDGSLICLSNDIRATCSLFDILGWAAESGCTFVCRSDEARRYVNEIKEA